MQNRNINFKNRAGNSSHNFANRVSALCASLRASTRKIKQALSSLVSYAFWCASAHREQANADTMRVGTNRTRRSLDKSLYSKITGWSLAALAMLGAFSNLTFMPEQAFAVYDWETRTLSDIDTMQQMNAKICENSEIGESKQLEDTRDRVNGEAATGKKYWVTKLKGDTAGTKEKGECWMTQNLDFDLSTSKTLTPADSDVLVDWTPENNTKTGDVDSGWSSVQMEVQSWDPGTYYYKYVSGWTDCGTPTINMSACPDKGNWTINPIDVINTSDTISIKTIAEAEHYHVGNYYSWNAATAGTGGEIKSGQATSSICPKGWRLPTSNSTTADFSKLMGAYGLRTDNGEESNVDKVRILPMYFIPAGQVMANGFRYAGNSGYYWSSLPVSNTHAYNFNFHSGRLVPSDGDNRYYGHSVRCVAADIYPEKPPITDNDTANVAITVSPVISIDVTKDANDMTVDFTKVATSTIVARVGSNQPYQVLLSTDKSDLTNSNTNQTIPMIPSDQPIVKGANSWGIKKLSSPTDTTVNDSTIYSPVGINGDKALFYESTSAASEDLTFPVAIAVDSSLPSGQYSTQVTLTAVAM